MPLQLADRFGVTGEIGSLGFSYPPLRTAESIFPTKMRRDAMVRDVLAVLLRHSRRDVVGQELQAMARRAGLPV